MNIPLDDELKGIFARIRDEGHSEREWAEVESDDMFQTEHFVGGFDATEGAFCFSYFDPRGDEFWFQLSLADVEGVLAGAPLTVIGRPAEQ